MKIAKGPRKNGFKQCLKASEGRLEETHALRKLRCPTSRHTARRPRTRASKQTFDYAEERAEICRAKMRHRKRASLTEANYGGRGLPGGREFEVHQRVPAPLFGLLTEKAYEQIRIARAAGSGRSDLTVFSRGPLFAKDLDLNGRRARSVLMIQARRRETSARASRKQYQEEYCSHCVLRIIVAIPRYEVVLGGSATFTHTGVLVHASSVLHSPLSETQEVCGTQVFCEWHTSLVVASAW